MKGLARRGGHATFHIPMFHSPRTLFFLSTQSRWILLRSRQNTKGEYSFDTVERPERIVRGAELCPDTSFQTCKIKYKKEDTNLVGHVTFISEKQKVITTDKEEIPVVFTTTEWVLFPDTKYQESYDCYSLPEPKQTAGFPWGVPVKVLVPVREVIREEVRVEVPSSGTRFPRHLVKTILDLAVSKGDTCPITMETFTKDSIVLTPCGHLFCKEGLVRALDSCRGQCPTCRARVGEGELQGY